MKDFLKCLIAAVLFMGMSAPSALAQSPRLDPSFAITSATDSLGGAGFGDMVLQVDGKLIVSGRFNTINGRPAPGLARLLPGGQVDTAFAAPPINDIIRCLALQADGKLLIGGDFLTVGGQSPIGIARLLANGRLDPGFLPPFGSSLSAFPAHSSVRRIVMQPGKGLLVLGILIPLTGIGGSFVARLSEATGVRDTTFRLPANVDNNVVSDVLVLPGGHLAFSGQPSLFNGRPCPVWGALPDGATDPAFVPLPGINTYSSAYALARDPATGNIYVVRAMAGQGVLDHEPVRLLPNGVLDPTFRVTGFPQPFGGAASVAVQPNGRLLLCGGFYVAGGGFHCSARLLPSGALDPTYDPSLGPTQGDGAKVLIQPDGKLLFAGLFAEAGGFALTGLARMLDPNVLGAARAGAADADGDELAAWPVPAHDVLHLRLPAGRVARQVALLDALGRVVRRQAVPAGQAAPVLPVAGLAPGAYLLRVDFAAGAPAYCRVAVE